MLFLFATGVQNVTHAVTDLSIDSTRLTVIIAKLQWEMTVETMYRSSAWRKIRLLFFHGLMLSYFISSKMWNRGKASCQLFLVLVTYPISHYCPYVSYVSGIMFSVWGLMYVDTIRIFALALEPDNPYSWANYTILGVDNSRLQASTTLHALPEFYMVLDSIRLKQEFIGWLSKIGIGLLGFLDAMHKIGMNSIFLMIILRANSLQ